MKNVLQNRLAWSEQKAKSIHTCQRQYAYKWLQAWEGRLADSSPEKQEAYQLNSVIPDLRIVVGNIMHDRTGRILKRIASEMVILPADEIRIAQQDFDRFILDSKKLPLSSLGRRNKKLLADPLEEPLSVAFVASERASIATMLQNFFALPELAAFTSNPACLLRAFIESEIGPPTHELGVPARLVTDAVFVDGKTVVVCDWKAGKPRPEEHKFKGVIYDVFIRERLGLPEDSRVQIRFVYLRNIERFEFEATKEEREEARWRVGEEFAFMQQKSAHPELNIGNPDTFPATTGFHCLSCAHQVMCSAFKKAATRGLFHRFEAPEALK